MYQFPILPSIGVVLPIAGMRSKNHIPQNMNQNKFWKKYRLRGTPNLIIMLDSGWLLGYGVEIQFFGLQRWKAHK